MFSSYWSTITQINWLNRKNARKMNTTISAALQHSIINMIQLTLNVWRETSQTQCVCVFLSTYERIFMWWGEFHTKFSSCAYDNTIFDFLQMLKQEPSNKNFPSFVWRRHKLLLFAFILNELIWINRLALHWASFVVNEYQFFQISLTKF